MYTHIEDISVWKRVQIGLQDTEVASFMSSHFMEDSHYRIVVQRTEDKDKTPDLFGKRYTYRCIITNASYIWVFGRIPNFGERGDYAHTWTIARVLTI